MGTQLYVAPEVVRGERYSEKCDVYSFAVVLLAMLELRPDVLDVFAEALSALERSETGITEERLKEPEDVAVTDACKTCPLNKQYQAPPGESMVQRHRAQVEQQCPLAKHKEFKGVVAHAVTRAVVYDDLRPAVKGCPYPALKALIEKCWDPEAAERPSFASVVDALDSAVRKEVLDYTRPAPLASQGLFPGPPFGAGAALGGPTPMAAAAAASRGGDFLARSRPAVSSHHPHHHQHRHSSHLHGNGNGVGNGVGNGRPSAAAVAAAVGALSSGAAAVPRLRQPQWVAPGSGGGAGTGSI